MQLLFNIQGWCINYKWKQIALNSITLRRSSRWPWAVAGRWLVIQSTPTDTHLVQIIFSSGITCTFSLHDSMCITARFECHFLLHGYISQVDSCPLLWQFVFHLFFKLRGSSGDKFAIENAYLDNLSKLLYINVKGST